ncbi:MAG: hypothetical protein ACREA9_17345 [Pyrinomonadaceae bacterium]
MSKFKISALTTLVIMALILVTSMVHSEKALGRTPATTAAPQSSCDLFVTSVTGDVGAFTVAGSGTATLLISTNTVTGMQSINVGTATNATVTISPFMVGTFDPVPVSASAIDPNLPASFTLTAIGAFGHNITVTAVLQCPTPPAGCTRTQGYWKNHADAWPVQSLTLGTVTYTKAQLISILRTPVRGNGLISLSYQLIAAKLNQASGTSVPPAVASAIAAADALIGGLVVPPIGSGSLAPDSTSSLTAILDAYNNGLTAGGPPHCD